MTAMGGSGTPRQIFQGAVAPPFGVYKPRRVGNFDTTRVSSIWEKEELLLG